MRYTKIEVVDERHDCHARVELPGGRVSLGCADTGVWVAHIRRPILDLRGKLASFEIDDWQVVQIADEDELEAVYGRSELGKRGTRVSRCPSTPAHYSPSLW